MPLLHIDSSILGQGSVSRRLSADAVAVVTAAAPGIEVVYRDLAAEPISHLSGAYASVLIKMPGVTLDMFNWWFIWHPQESLRYKIWDKDDHFAVQVSDADRRRFNDPALPLANRLWGSVHHIRENIGLPTPIRFVQGMISGDPYPIAIHFLPPEQCGFDMKRFDFSKESVICADSGMRHYVRKTADGIELRSRFFDGYVRKNGAFVRGGSAADVAIESALNHHMLKEFTNLAHILPALYAEEANR